MPPVSRTASLPADASAAFSTEHLEADLRTQAVRGGAVTIAGQACKLVIATASTMILCRCLAPGDFGLIAMVVAVTGFVSLFKDMGLSIATMQRPEINQGQVSTLFWINVALGVLTAAIAGALAPIISGFYGEPRLTGITLALSSAFVLGGLAVQHQGLLRRQMKFTTLAIIDAASLFVGAAVAIAAALSGAGYWALVFSYPTTALVYTVGVWATCQWRPGWPVRRSGVRSMLSFGGHLTGFSLINYLIRHLDNVLIGWYWGSELLGYYSKAYALLLLPMNQINAPVTYVAIAGLSRLQNDPQRFRNYYLKPLALVTFVTFPLVTLLFFMPREVILLFLGPQWGESVPILRYLAVVALAHAVCNTTGWFLIGAGKPDRMVKWALFVLPLTTAAFAIGLRGGPTTVALCYSIVSVLLVAPCIFYVTRGVPITPKDIVGAVWQQLCAALLSGTAGFAIVQLGFRSLPDW
ncbi:lipopolysaccharide biosynthesis protein, partial [Candidatus Sumerlaeota bacterium]|nr:lipopolysaccharide biosynthesis protein [Candidatus Sumerlaeota bacterium]